MQVPEVLRAALGQVAVGLGDDPRRDGGLLHQFGVGGLLTTEHDERRPGVADPAEPVAEVLRAPEDARDDDVSGVDGVPQLGVTGSRRVGHHVVGAARAGTEQVGVGGAEQHDARHGGSFAGCPRPAFGRM